MNKKQKHKFKKIIKWSLFGLLSLLVATIVNFQIKNKKIHKNYTLTESNESFELIKNRFGNPDDIRTSDDIFIVKYYDNSFIIRNKYYFKFYKTDSLLIGKVVD